MWRRIKGFPDYVMTDIGMFYKISTGKTFVATNGKVSLKDADGIWRNRSVKRLLSENFNTLVATPIYTGEPVAFYDLRTAIKWLLDTKQATYAGKLVRYETIRRNILWSIQQPENYPSAYGYRWEIVERSK
jgi:hypothetical protein